MPSSRENEGTDDESGGSGNRLSFRLPPFHLPEFFPPDFEVRIPLPGGPPERRVGATTVLVACIAFDIIDAILALAVGASAVGGVRSFGGLVLAATVADVFGLVYAWELVAVLVGYPELTVFPSLTLLLVIRAWR